MGYLKPKVPYLDVDGPHTKGGGRKLRFCPFAFTLAGKFLNAAAAGGSSLTPATLQQSPRPSVLGEIHNLVD